MNDKRGGRKQGRMKGRKKREGKEKKSENIFSIETSGKYLGACAERKSE